MKIIFVRFSALPYLGSQALFQPFADLSSETLDRRAFPLQTKPRFSRQADVGTYIFNSVKRDFFTMNDELENIRAFGKILIARQYLCDHGVFWSPTGFFLQVIDANALQIGLR